MSVRESAVCVAVNEFSVSFFRSVIPEAIADMMVGMIVCSVVEYAATTAAFAAARRKHEQPCCYSEHNHHFHFTQTAFPHHPTTAPMLSSHF